MNDSQHNALLDAVDLLTLPRKVRTMQDPKPPFAEGTEHTEEHPPLLVMLLEGTGITGDGTSRDPGIPIDADALEMWGQIRDLIRLWCKQLVVKFDQDDMLGSIRRWYQVHNNRVRAGLTSDVIDRDVTRMVEGWVRMIETKFDPAEKREWTYPCPAFILRSDGDGGTQLLRCGARRVMVNGEERFAISLNVTTMTAECSHCHTRWVGDRGIATLRHESNLWEMVKAEDEAERMAELERLAAGDTPQENVGKVVA
jgi:hypothetical protein